MSFFRKPSNVVLLFSIGFLLILGLSACQPGAPFSQPTRSATEPAAAASQPAGLPTPEPGSSSAAMPGSLPGSAAYQGIPVGFTAEGHPYQGDPDAPVTIEEYSDYLCPFCERHFSQTIPGLLEKYVRDGRVKYVFRDMPLVSLHPTAPVGHVAARCAGEQGADKYWQMHDALFASRVQWSNLPDPASFVNELAGKIGVQLPAYEACIAAGEAQALVEQGVAAGQALGFNGTPSFQFIRHSDAAAFTLVGAQPLSMFEQYIDALLAGEDPPQAEQPEQAEPQLPFWASAEGLAPDPARPATTLAGDAYKGDPQAKVVVVEFSDFQCPACQQHALEVQPAVDAALVDNGQVLWVFKQLPLQMHPQALVAAAAAECAAVQGQFWPMHDLLFAQQELWAVDDPEPALLDLASSLELDAAAFSTCLESRQPLEQVIRDLYDSQGVVTSTPTFIILFEGKGQLLKGSPGAEKFIEILQGLLDQGTAAP